jgi:hypothetical protein
MAKRPTNQRSQRRGLKTPQQSRRFVFEPGEKAIPIPAATSPVSIKELGQGSLYLPLPAIPDLGYLRVLGYEARCSLLGDGVKFLDGPSMVSQMTRALKDMPAEAKSMPILKVVGPPGAKVTVTATWRVLYKDH